MKSEDVKTIKWKVKISAIVIFILKICQLKAYLLEDLINTTKYPTKYPTKLTTK